MGEKSVQFEVPDPRVSDFVQHLPHPCRRRDVAAIERLESQGCGEQRLGHSAGKRRDHNSSSAVAPTEPGVVDAKQLARLI